MKPYKSLSARIPYEFQFHSSRGFRVTLFQGVCDLDGHGQAPRDGFMATLETGDEEPVVITVHECESDRKLMILAYSKRVSMTCHFIIHHAIFFA